MQKKFAYFSMLCVFAGWLASTALHAQSKTATSTNHVLSANGNIIATTKPLFSFENGSSFDFGTVTQSGKIYHDFVFTNIGFEPLIIAKVHTSCYCIHAEWDKTPVLPGQRGTIRVYYDTRVRIGNFRNGVSIVSNAYSYPDETLLISGNIVGGGKTD